MIGLYAGALPLVMREVPFSQIQYPVYELLKLMSINLLAFRSGVSTALVFVPAYINLINGAISGAIAGFTTNPFDVLKMFSGCPLNVLKMFIGLWMSLRYLQHLLGMSGRSFGCLQDALRMSLGP